MPKHFPSMDFGPSTQQFDTPPPTHEALPAGTRLGGYQIIEVLGRGGFGIVYLALDASLQRQVAIKEYLPAETAMRCADQQVWVRPGADPAAYAAGKDAFLAEAKMLARFDHPSLARVHTFWEENRTAYMVMPYYDGQTLAAVLASLPRPPDETWLRTLLGPLLNALTVLHMSQCLHLDISPDNIIVLRDGRPVLLDFGVASRFATDKTMPLTALLNPAYAPIEQYSESAALPQGPWSDLYALASVLHFAIAGKPPARATVRAVEDPQRPLAETVQELQSRFPGLAYSPHFLEAIDRALAVRPRDRVRDVPEFQSLIDRGLSGRGPAMPPAPPAAGAGSKTGAQAPTAQPKAPPPSAAAPGSRAEAGASAFGSSTFGASTFGTSASGAQRHEPLFQPPPVRDENWMAAEPRDVHLRAKPTRHTGWWLAAVCTLVLAGVGGWAWLQRQPAQAEIGSRDLPDSVLAKVPPPPGRAPAATADPLAPPASAPTTTVTAPSPEASTAGLAEAATAAGPQSSPAPAASAPSTTTAAAASAVPAPASSVATVAAATPPPLKAAPPVPAPARKTVEARKPVEKPVEKPAPNVAAAITPAEPNNPKGVCGSRTNFALLYCMQTQCKRPKFTTHPQCQEMRLRGEL